MLEDGSCTKSLREEPEAKPIIEGFANLVSLMNRFLTRLANAEPFKNSKLGLSEWRALLAIRSAEGANNKKLAQLLGITVQRAAQISDSLKGAGLIRVVQSEADSRKNVMTTTEAGRAEADTLNETLLLLLTERMDGNFLVVQRTRRGLRSLMKLVLVPRPPSLVANRGAQPSHER